LAREDLSGRVALVTGAAGGLGSMMAEALLKAGWRAVLSGTRATALQDAFRHFPAAQLRCVEADLSREGAAESLAGQAMAAFGRVDMLLNNAGLSSSAIEGVAPDKPVPLWSIPTAMLERFYRVNTLAPLRLAAALVPQMVERGWGRVVNVTTGLGTMLSFGGYGGSKAALEAETACLAKALAGTGVTVNVLLPGGPTATRMTRNFPTPAGKMLQPEIMIGPILYLASEASSAVTGRRFIAKDWDPALPADKAASIAGAPVAWTALAPSPADAPPQSRPGAQPPIRKKHATQESSYSKGGRV
jgi:NAD(P)-dependent dehydrogenase (short-subunit alcohol dehydrogenase family)